VAHWPRKKPLDFGGNPDHVVLKLGLRLGGGTTIIHMEGRVMQHLFNSNSFMTSASCQRYALYWMLF